MPLLDTRMFRFSSDSSETLFLVGISSSVEILMSSFGPKSSECLSDLVGITCSFSFLPLIVYGVESYDVATGSTRLEPIWT